MTFEEAIKDLEQLKQSFYDLDINKSLCGSLNMAIEVLEKQIPKKPIRQHGNHDCPVCNKPAKSVTLRNKKFCDFCGQALDWSE